MLRKSKGVTKMDTFSFYELIPKKTTDGYVNSILEYFLRNDTFGKHKLHAICFCIITLANNQ